MGTPLRATGRPGYRHPLAPGGWSGKGRSDIVSTGKVIQVIGPVVDVEFPPGHLPNIYNALKVSQEENKAAGKPAVRITLEVAQ
ncbi:MAG: hypothetical protein ACT4OL_04925, partial [Nitrospiraceae bacterium]